MSKRITDFFTSYASPEMLVKKLSGKNIAPGARVLPTDRRDDKAAQLRIDAGEKIDGKQNLVLQVNSRPDSSGLRKWLKSNGRGTHGKLATSVFDTEATDQKAEAVRVAEDLEKQAKKNVR